MADHLVFALEALSALGAGTALDGAVVWSELRVYVCMGADFLHFRIEYKKEKEGDLL